MFENCNEQTPVKASTFSLASTDWAASESSKHPVTHASTEPPRASWTIWGLCRLKCFRGEISWSYKHAVHIIKLSSNGEGFFCMDDKALEIRLSTRETSASHVQYKMHRAVNVLKELEKHTWQVNTVNLDWTPCYLKECETKYVP